MKRAGDKDGADTAKTKYVENKKSAGDKSSVWFYFLRATDGSTAKCKQCNRILKAAGSSTSSLRNHLRSKHSIDLKENTKSTTEPIPSTSAVDPYVFKGNEDTQTDPSKPKKHKITHFFTKLHSVENVVSKMAALDGLPFKTFCSSEELRKLFSKSGYKLPSSPNSIKNMVIKANDELRNSIIKELEELKSDGVRFAITLDEWTSNRNRRYINVNLFSPYFSDNAGYKNLGLVRISAKGTAQHCLECLKKKLSNFRLSLDEDVICLTTDGANVMLALGRAARANQQLCLAHGIQLGIIDVLYKKTTEVTRAPGESSENEEEDSDNSENSDDEDGGFQFDVRVYRRNLVQTLFYKDIIEKVRYVSKMFRKSPTKNDILSKYVMADHDNKDLKLILDCKTRWSSMADMITRFLKIKDSVSKALIDLKSDIQFNDAELLILTELADSLAVIKATVEVLCQRDANLITAVTAIKFMLKKLQEDSSSIGTQLANSLESRIKQRLTNLTGILLYLHSPTTYYKDLLDGVNDPIALDNEQIRSYIVNIINKHFSTTTPTATTTQENENVEQSHTVVNIPRSIKDQLGQEIKKALKQHTSTNPTSPSTELDLETKIRVEMALYDSGGKMGEHLTKVYKALKSIPPTSVESERAFSSAGLMCNKIRSTLNDDSLDALVSLRSFYQSKKY